MNGKKTRPVILVTRKLPPAVEARIARDYECILNGDDRLYDDAELVDQSDGVDAIVCCHTETSPGRLSDSFRIAFGPSSIFPWEWIIATWKRLGARGSW